MKDKDEEVLDGENIYSAPDEDNNENNYKGNPEKGKTNEMEGPDSMDMTPVDYD